MCRYQYLDTAIFQPSKTKFVLVIDQISLVQRDHYWSFVINLGPNTAFEMPNHPISQQGGARLRFSRFSAINLGSWNPGYKKLEIKDSLAKNWILIYFRSSSSLSRMCKTFGSSIVPTTFLAQWFLSNWWFGIWRRRTRGLFLTCDYFK